MGIFDNLQATRNEKIDLIRMALSNYTSPYRVNGSDATAINNLTNFISDNIIFKKRQDYNENDLSSLMYKYAYRYFTQFVNPISTVDLMETMILYNRYMVFNIAENALSNIFNISEKFTYTVTLIDDSVNNINQDSSRTYRFSIPYVNNEYRENYIKVFKLNGSQFSVNGKILNLGINGDSINITTDFELSIENNNNPITYDLTYNNVRVAYIQLQLVETNSKSREYTIEDYSLNIIENFEKDINRFIDNMYISDETKTKLIDKGIITWTDEEEIDKNTELLLSVKKSTLRNTLEEIKTTNVLNGVVSKYIVEYSQNPTYNYVNNITGLNIWVSKLAQDTIKHISEQIKFTGIELDELYIIFKNSVSSYIEADFPESYTTTFEGFLNNMFRWYDGTNSTTDPDILIDFSVDVSNYFFISEFTDAIDDSIGFETYKNSLLEIIKVHLHIYLYKFFILMDIKTINSTISSEKDKAINSYEIDQISESKPINYINVVHRINNDIISKLQSMIDILKINVNGAPLDISGEKMLSLTFQYKELNKEIYDLFMQDQVETYIANWLARTGSVSSLFNSIYINNFNESAWELATSLDITSYTLLNVRYPHYFEKVKMLTGNVINFREKDFMDIVGYYFNSYDDIYYGLNAEHRQEIALFLRSFQDVREYYFKNILLKSLVNDDEYPLYEYILLITMALDRYFNLKVSKHKHLDSFSSEDIENFLNSFGLSELNRYDNFYGSFDYKMSVIRNYNNLIKNKGTRRVKRLIENMLNEANDEYEVSINEYYLVKSTKNSINYVDKWYYNGNIYTWTLTGETGEDGSWVTEPISTVYAPIPYRWYDRGTTTLYTYVDGAWNLGENVPSTQPSEPIEGYMWYNDTVNILYTYTSGEWVAEPIDLPSTQPDTYTYIDADGISIPTVGYTWYDKNTNIEYVSVLTPSNTIYTEEEIINPTNAIPLDSDSPEDIGIIQYNPKKDETVFISMPEGSTRPITTIKNKVDSNTTVNYEDFTKDDGYWNKDITQEFINGPDDLNLNISKTKYLSISASINMEVAKIMNMYIMSILDNLLEKMKYDLTIESYSDDYIALNDIKYTELIRYIKFVNAHLHDILSPVPGEKNIEVANFASLPFTGKLETIYIALDTGFKYTWNGTEYVQMKFYGIPKITDMADKLDNFETQLKDIIANVEVEEIEEFLKDKVDDNLEVGSFEGTIYSMNRYAYETDINNVKAVPGSKAFLTSRLDGTLLSGKVENQFADKLRKLLLGFGYSSIDYQNSATFILDLLESTNLISIIEIPGADYISTKAKYLKLMAIDGISSQTINIGNLYAVNLRSLLQMLIDHTQNKIFQEDYTLKDSSVTNTLAINNTFIRILDLVIETFFERPDSVYNDDVMETILSEETHDTEYNRLPDFMKDFVDLLRQETITETEKQENLPKYNFILNSMNTILSFMTSAGEYSLLSTVNTISKNFSDEEYLNFLISLLSFFMSYKVTLYEENHQLDLSNPRETLVFAEDLVIWSELKLEEDWFFDEEIIDMEV